MLNLFSLHGKYFENNENRLTANFLFLLSELRSTFLPAFLNSVGITNFDPANVEITMQPPITVNEGPMIPDAFIRSGDDFLVVVEAKIGTYRLSQEQLEDYAIYAAEQKATIKRLVAITQIEESSTFADAKSRIETVALAEGSCYYIRWFRLLQLLRDAVQLSPDAESRLERGVLNGRQIDYEKRLVSLFLEEVEATMYEKIVVDEKRAGELEEVRLTTQNAWFMDVALRHRVWFPDGSLSHGLAPSLWIAFYEMADSQTSPSQITHIARNRIFWNRITFDDAENTPELAHLFADPAVRDEIRSWPKNHNETFHVVLTDAPVRLARPIPLAGSKRAKFSDQEDCWNWSIDELVL